MLILSGINIAATNFDDLLILLYGNINEYLFPLCPNHVITAIFEFNQYFQVSSAQ